MLTSVLITQSAELKDANGERPGGSLAEYEQLCVERPCLYISILKAREEKLLL